MQSTRCISAILKESMEFAKQTVKRNPTAKGQQKPLRCQGSLCLHQRRRPQCISPMARDKHHCCYAGTDEDCKGKGKRPAENADLLQSPVPTPKKAKKVPTVYQPCGRGARCTCAICKKAKEQQVQMAYTSPRCPRSTLLYEKHRHSCVR